jgi:hypothetical protein
MVAESRRSALCLKSSKLFWWLTYSYSLYIYNEYINEYIYIYIYIHMNIFVIFNFTFFAALIIYFIPMLLLAGFLKIHTTLCTLAWTTVVMKHPIHNEDTETRAAYLLSLFVRSKLYCLSHAMYAIVTSRRLWSTQMETRRTAIANVMEILKTTNLILEVLPGLSTTP